MNNKKFHFESFKRDGFISTEDIFEGIHLGSEAKEAYASSPEKLDPEVLRKIDQHRSICQSCGEEIDQLIDKKEREKEPEQQDLPVGK